MNQSLLQQIDAAISSILIRHYSNSALNVFDEFITFCENYYQGPAHTLAEIRTKQNTKLKGDVFEYFALRYFQHCFRPHLTDVWLLKDVPEEVLAKLKLKRQDVGIDLIGRSEDDKYFAIQAKYRKKGYKATHGIGWKHLSTFYALVSRTGPFTRHIVITNANWVRHIGKKSKQDLSICYGTLRKIPTTNWVAMSGSKGHSLVEESVERLVVPPPKFQPTQVKSEAELLRERRLAYFANKIET